MCTVAILSCFHRMEIAQGRRRQMTHNVRLKEKWIPDPCDLIARPSSSLLSLLSIRNIFFNTILEYILKNESSWCAR